jgi:hypothetical protein
MLSPVCHYSSIVRLGIGKGLALDHYNSLVCSCQGLLPGYYSDLLPAITELVFYYHFTQVLELEAGNH